MGKFDDIFNSGAEPTIDETEVVVETPATEVETPSSDVSTEVETPSSEIEANVEIDKVVDTNVEGIDKDKKTWRERYQETDDFKAKVRKQDEAIYNAKLKEIEEIENNPAFQIVAKALKEGKDPMEEFRKVAVDNISALTPKDLFMKDLEKYKDSLTEEEISEEIEKFEGKSKLEQIKATENIKAELTAAREAELAKFKPTTAEVKLDPETQAKVNKFDADFEARLAALDGQTINGVTFTPSVLTKIEETIANGDISPKLFIDENGDFDAGEAIELAVLKHYRQAYLNGLKGEYKSNGIKEALKQKHNVGSGKAKTTGMPDSSSAAAKKKADIDFVFGKSN